MNSGIIWTNKKQSTKGLKKTAVNEWYDSTSGQFYKKENGRIKAYEDSTDKKYYKYLQSQLKVNNRADVLTGDINKLKDLHNAYTKELKRFNSGKSKTNIPLLNAKRAYDTAYNGIFEQMKTSNRKRYIDTKTLVRNLRVRGVHGVTIHNARASLDLLVREFSEKLDLDTDTTLELLLPKGLEETTVYEEIQDIVIDSKPNLYDIMYEKVESGELSEGNYRYLRNLEVDIKEALFNEQFK